MKTIELKDDWFVRVPDHFGFWEMSKYRFDPITALLVGGAVIGAVGELQEGRAAEAEASASQKISNYNAAVMEQESNTAIEKAKFDMHRSQDEGQRQIGSLIASLGASGAQLGTGAPQRILEEQIAQNELDKLLIGYEGMNKAARAESQATEYRMQGQLAKMRGENAKTASYFGAGSSLLQGFGSAALYSKKGE